jgi:hypothetical protein
LIAAAMRHAIALEPKQAARMLALFKRMLPNNLAALELKSLPLEHRRTCRAQASLLPAQAGRDGPGIGDFAGAQPVDIGCAGPALLRCALRGCRPRRKHCEEEAERGSDYRHTFIHDCVSVIRPALDSAGVIRANTRNIFREM